ncbi:13943_t:CDS:2 [Acaulospora colombiana]|uniref:13943_t:CDS:1 n=1 Tax=Acaulospora colombiana TaxID=27376 RepID=A0ACA9KN49_9GLOM|nr:13943_t:CDS:2 [Acaulospora colombiana]
MSDDKLVLNLVFQDSHLESTSIRSKIKEVRGGWKEKNRVRKSLKKNVTSSHQVDSVKAENKQSEKSKFKKDTIIDGIQQRNGGTSLRIKENTGTIGKTQVISSIFTYNPEIVDIGQDASASKQTHDQPSNAPVKGDSTFFSMGLNHDLVSNMKEKLGIADPTNIQRRAIPILNDGDSDVVIQAETGSGKTLTYLLPVVNRLMCATIEIQSIGERTLPISRSVGTLAIILTPTRELAKQILAVINSLVDIPPSKLCTRHLKHWIVPGSVTGGEKRHSEKARLRKGINILVSTPGRLLDHLQNTESFLVKNLRWLVLDEADRLLEMGFEETLRSILKVLEERTKDDIQNYSKNQLFTSPKLPRKRQTILCSATLRDGVQRLAGHSLINPTFIRGNDPCEKDVDPRNSNYTTPNQLKQAYVITPAKLRLVTLTAILKSTFRAKTSKDQKIIVFLSCRDSVDFHFDLFCHSGKIRKEETDESDDKESINSGAPDEELSKGSSDTSTMIPETTIYKLHGDLSQSVRTEIFNNFSEAEAGILFCTDVAARGLDLPDVSKIIQYDPPTDLKDYVHRVGRTARLGKRGEAIIFLLPSEIEYIHALKSFQIHAEPVQVETLLKGLTHESKSKSYELEATDIQLKFEGHVLSNPKSTEVARKAFLSYIRAYATHSSSEKHIFHVKKLHLGHIAKSFGLRETPSDIHPHPDENIINNITLEIENFNYSTNIVPELEYSLKYICDDMDCQMGIRYTEIQKGNPFENPGWKGLEERIDSMSCRVVPPDQREILDATPGLIFNSRRLLPFKEIQKPDRDESTVTDDESSVTISSPDSTECAMEPSGERVVESDEELSTNVTNEQLQMIRKGSLKRKYERGDKRQKRKKFFGND